MACQRNAERLLAELDSRNTAAAMRTYADEIESHVTALKSSNAQAAREWADWIRQHAERTDSLNGPLRLRDRRGAPAGHPAPLRAG